MDKIDPIFATQSSEPIPFGDLRSAVHSYEGQERMAHLIWCMLHPNRDREARIAYVHQAARLSEDEKRWLRLMTGQPYSKLKHDLGVLQAKQQEVGRTQLFGPQDAKALMCCLYVAHVWGVANIHMRTVPWEGAFPGLEVTLLFYNNSWRFEGLRECPHEALEGPRLRAWHSKHPEFIPEQYLERWW